MHHWLKARLGPVLRADLNPMLEISCPPLDALDVSSATRWPTQVSFSMIVWTEAMMASLRLKHDDFYISTPFWYSLDLFYVLFFSVLPSSTLLDLVFLWLECLLNTLQMLNAYFKHHATQEGFFLGHSRSFWHTHLVGIVLKAICIFNLKNSQFASTVTVSNPVVPSNRIVLY